MTTVELRTSIVAELNQMSVEMLESVQHYVQRLRRPARTVNRTAATEEVPDIVLSLLGAGTPVSDDDLNARKAIEAMRRQSEQNGNVRLTLDDINNEIQQTRAARRVAGLCSQRLRGIASHAPKNFDYKKELENRF